MKISIKNISVEFADMSTYSEPHFVIISYVVDWEYANLVTLSKLSGSIKTKQIIDQKQVYAEIREFIKDATK